jgi:hypothetical protein
MTYRSYIDKHMAEEAAFQLKYTSVLNALSEASNSLEVKNVDVQSLKSQLEIKGKIVFDLENKVNELNVQLQSMEGISKSILEGRKSTSTELGNFAYLV